MVGRIVGIALVLAALSASSARADDPADAEAQRALVAFKEGRFEEAVDALERAYDLQPKAIYIYNMGRALEQIGRLEAARQTYLRVPAIVGVTDEVKALAREKAESLRALTGKSVIRFSGLAPGTLVQLDGDVLTDLGADVVLTADRHTVCVQPPASERLSCHVPRLTAGTRLDWPSGDAATARAILDIPSSPEITVLKLDGVLIRGDWRTIRSLDIDPGTYAIGVRYRDGTAWTRDVDLVSGAPLSLSSISPRAEPAVEATIGVSPDAGSPGPWPWIVVGTGAAATAAGIGLLVKAYLLQNPDDGTHQADAEGQWEEGRPYVVAGWSLVGTGAAALIGGIVWNAVSDTDTAVTATISPSEAGAFFLVHGSW